MSEFEPSSYSREALMWAPPQSDYKEQVLSSKLGRAGMLIQDILYAVPTEVEESEPAERRMRSFEGVEVNYEDVTLISDVIVMQSKKPFKHDFTVVVEFDYPTHPNLRAVVSARWGVDDPENQILYAQTTRREDGEIINAGTEPEIDNYFKELITANLTAIACKSPINEQAPEGDTNKTPDIWEIEKHFNESEEKCLRASFDSRLMNVVETVTDIQNYPINYQHLAEILDEIEQDYQLEPIELVQAYGMCEARKIGDGSEEMHG